MRSKIPGPEKTNQVDDILTDETIAYISKTLPRYDWVKLAYMLGFLPQNIAFFNDRASSSENHYSQCCLMLKTWRSNMTTKTVIPRLCDAFRRMRRTDLAIKFGTDMALGKSETEESPPPEQQLLTTRTNHVQTPRTSKPKQINLKENIKLFPDHKLDDLARKLLQREEWKRLAYALGLLPEDVAHVIGRASSGQNLFAQARYMLELWRSRTSAEEIPVKLGRAFARIRRHDLSHLHSLGRFTAHDKDERGKTPEMKDDQILIDIDTATQKNMVGERMSTHIHEF